MVTRGNRNPTSVYLVKRRGRRGLSYRLRWVDPLTGLVRSESCGRDLAYARGRRQAKAEELRSGLLGRPLQRTIDDLIDALPRWMAGRAGVTVQQTCRSLRRLRDLCGNRRVHQIDRAMIMEFRSHMQSASAATVNKELRQVKSALSYGVDAGWIATNPLWRWKAMRVVEPQRRIRIVEPAEFGALLHACPLPEFRVLCELAYYQGCRRTECVNLRWEQVDLVGAALHVVNLPEHGELTKSRRSRVVPLASIVRDNLSRMLDAAEKVLREGKSVPKWPHVFCWRDGRRWKPDWVCRQFAKWSRVAGIPHCTFHDLRRSFSTLAQRAGVDRSLVKDLGGWSSLGVVERHYTGEIGQPLRGAMDRIDRSRRNVG